MLTVAISGTGANLAPPGFLGIRILLIVLTVFQSLPMSPALDVSLSSVHYVLWLLLAKRPLLFTYKILVNIKTKRST